MFVMIRALLELPPSVNIKGKCCTGMPGRSHDAVPTTSIQEPCVKKNIAKAFSHAPKRKDINKTRLLQEVMNGLTYLEEKVHE